MQVKIPYELFKFLPLKYCFFFFFFSGWAYNRSTEVTIRFYSLFIEPETQKGKRSRKEGFEEAREKSEIFEMDVIKSQQISSRPVEKVIVHPLVLLSIVDNYNRVAKDTRKRVVGVLLGSSFKGTVDVSNSYAGQRPSLKFQFLSGGISCFEVFYGKIMQL